MASMAKLKAGRLGRELTDALLQFWGGMGFTSEVYISRYKAYFGYFEQKFCRHRNSSVELLKEPQTSHPCSIRLKRRFCSFKPSNSSKSFSAA